MKIEWHHIPEDRSKMLPEQWQARATGCGLSRSIAVLREGQGQWEAVLTGPDGVLGTLITSVMECTAAQAEIESTLRDMGWR